MSNFDIFKALSSTRNLYAFFPHKMSPYVNEFKYKILTSKIQRTQGKKVQA